MRLASSNYGDTEDYMVIASATSEAAAIMSGFLSSGQKIEDFLNEDLIYSPDYEGKDEDANSFSDLTYNIDNFIFVCAASFTVFAGKTFQTFVETGVKK